jgi:hypothetical protein
MVMTESDAIDWAVEVMSFTRRIGGVDESLTVALSAGGPTRQTLPMKASMPIGQKPPLTGEIDAFSHQTTHPRVRPVAVATKTILLGRQKTE